MEINLTNVRKADTSQIKMVLISVFISEFGVHLLS